jgi:NAD(P)-dependent dehydrogenase (short-subunit alcohol dehydrogenase family)
MKEFSNQVVIITGASEGIGRALALELARQGARLALSARNRQRLEELAAECTSLGAETLVLPADVSIEAECRLMVEKTAAHWGRIDTLVANAGHTMWAKFEEVEDTSVFEDIMAVNYFGAMYCTRAALPWILKSRGRIVAVASIAGLTGVPARSGYCASKHAMVGFFDSLRIELADRGVTVTVIAPDFVVSKIHRRALDGQGSPLGETPMKEDRIMSAEDCAKLMTKAIADRKRLLITSRRGKLGRWLKLIWPGLIDRIAKRPSSSAIETLRFSPGTIRTR